MIERFVICFECSSFYVKFPKYESWILYDEIGAFHLFFKLLLSFQSSVVKFMYFFIHLLDLLLLVDAFIDVVYPIYDTDYCTVFVFYAFERAIVIVVLLIWSP